MIISMWFVVFTVVIDSEMELDSAAEVGKPK